jgi:hypothetical protein
MKTAELTGPALDWAVAQADGVSIERKQYSDPDDWDWYYNGVTYYPSQDWAIAGPIIEREKINIEYSVVSKDWTAGMRDFYQRPAWYGEGSTPLVAAMRCYVMSQLGNEVEVPEGLA